jgi:RNA polymerase sigma-70 factor (ECF subfamily)
MMTDETQTEISVEALKAGDRVEFARLVDLASAPIYRLGLKMLGNPQDAEDALQNTFLKALQSLGSFEGRSSPLTWLYRIAVNEALMLIRRQKPQVEIAEEPQDEESNLPTPVQLTDWCCLPESDFLTAESKRALDQAVLRLPEKLRVVFLLRDIEGMSIQETSEALGLTETAVKTRLLRARLNLREQLSSYFTEQLTEEREK